MSIKFTIDTSPFKQTAYFIGGKRGGFTLVELLVVVVILGILASLGVAGVRRALDRTQVAGSMRNLRQLALAATNYAADNGGRMLPHAVFDPELGENREWCFAYGQTGGPAGALQHGILGPYLGNAQKVLECPAFRIDPEVRRLLESGSFSKPAAVGYGYNGFFLSQKVDAANGHWEGFPLAAVEQPTRTVMFATSGQVYRRKSVQPCENIWPESYSRSPVIRAVRGDKALVAWVSGHVTEERISGTLSNTEPRLGHLHGEVVDSKGENLFDLR